MSVLDHLTENITCVDAVSEYLADQKVAQATRKTQEDLDCTPTTGQNWLEWVDGVPPYSVVAAPVLHT